MALLFMDSCDHYADSDGGKKWTTKNSNINLTKETQFGSINTGANIWPGGGGVHVWRTVVSTSGLQWNSGSSDATVIIGGWFFFQANNNALPGGVSNCIFLGQDSGTPQWTVGRDTSNRLIFQRGGGGGTLLATSTNTFQSGVWYFIEAKVTTNNSTGVYEVRVNGTSTGWIPQATGANTRSSGNNSTNQYIFMNSSNNNTEQSGRGLYVCNSGGAAPNDFVGVNMIRCLRPIAPGNSNSWTPNVGLNFAAVDEQQGDGDNSFVTSTTANQIDSFIFQDLESSGTVVAVQYVFEARQDGGAARTVAGLARIGSTNYAGTTKTMAGTHVYYTDPQNVSPATSAAWTASEINGAEFGYKLIS